MSAMEEWQRRLKAEKDAERQKKNESADMLRGYRGGDSAAEEALKLKTARDEERRKKEEAQRALQDYKGTDLEEVKKLKAKREEELKKKLDAQSNLHDYKAKEIDGLTTKREAHFTHQQSVPVPVNANRGEGSIRDEDDEMFTVSVSERAAWLTRMAEKSDIVPKPASLNATGDGAVPETEKILTAETSLLVTETSLQQKEITESEQPMNFSTEQSPAVTEETTKPEFGETSETNNAQIVSSRSDVEPSTADVDEEKKSEIDNTAPITNHEQRLPAQPTKVRLDILFSFGLVTIQTDPDLNPYMNAVETVVMKAIDDDANLKLKVLYDRNYKPFVKSTDWDLKYKSKSGRTDVKRMVVTASVPVFLNTVTGDSSVSNTRDGVVEALSAAIQTGSFLAIARGK